MAETPMRERIARIVRPWGWFVEGEGEHISPTRQAVREDGFRIADAVLATMEEPTEAMVAAAEACFFEHLPEARDWTVTMARQALRAAIRAAREGK